MKRWLRNVLYKGFLRLGFTIHRASIFQRSIAAIWLEKNEFVFAQVGAFDGVSHDDLYWLVTRYAGRGIVVEPLPDIHERLKQNYAWLSSVKAIQVAVHPSRDHVELFRVAPNNELVPNWAQGSSSFDPSWLTSQGVPEAAIVTERVPAMPLMALLSQSGLAELDVLQIDAEGFDHEIVRMLDMNKLRPRVIKYEYTKKHTADALRQENEMEQYLRSFGYTVYREGHDVVAIAK